MTKTKTPEAASMDNIYTLDGKVPLGKSIPFGLQHVLAMFVANIAPIMIVAGACGLSSGETASLIQTAMIMAGIGTMVQLFTLWKLGARLPIVMGISFTFVSIFCYVGPQWGYEAILGAVMVGGVIEGLLGFTAKYWRKIIAPIVSACVVTAIGFSLLSVLFGLVVGYIVALFMGKVDLSGLVSSLSACFGCLPITSFSQNIGLLSMTRVINRHTISTGAGIMILAGLFPAIGTLLSTLPEAVLGGCTIMMFGNIVISGLQMIGNCGYTQRNITIAALSLSIGIGFTQVPEMFNIFPDIICTIFAENCVAVVFLAAVILNLVIPQEQET